jgi:hypothetical protein
MTAQATDILYFEGQELRLLSNPLESLWSERHPRPRFVWASTALYRGYWATWIIENNMLYLTAVDGLVSVGQEGELRASLALLFPGAGKRVHAEWFAGELRVPKGDMVRRSDIPEGRVYERELHIVIDRGVVVGSEVVETGAAFRREVEARKLPLDQALPAQPDAEGWLTCPHCGRRFMLRQRRRWDGERHSCGGRISLEGDVAD